MATSVINDQQRMFIRKTYTYTYTAGADSRYNLTASNFGITAISGYTPVGISYAYSGNGSVNMRGINLTTSGTVMYIYNKSGSGVSGTSVTARVDIVWMRNDLVET